MLRIDIHDGAKTFATEISIGDALRYKNSEQRIEYLASYEYYAE